MDYHHLRDSRFYSGEQLDWHRPHASLHQSSPISRSGLERQQPLEIHTWIPRNASLRGSGKTRSLRKEYDVSQEGASCPGDP
jgi:hypothetical protein